MRKFTLLLSFLVLAGLAFGQEATLRPTINNNLSKANEQLNKTEAKGAVLWSEDFNGTKWSGTVTDDGSNGYSYNGTTALPEGWSVYDGNDLGYYWHWSDVGPRGTWTGRPGAFDPNQSVIDAMPGSTENGFMILESDFYHTTEGGQMSTDLKDMDAYVQFGPIDLSGHPYVQISFNQMFRYCCQAANTLSMFISNDYNPADPTSAHWTEFKTKGSTLSNDYTAVADRHPVVNISRQAGNKSNVYVRFKHAGSSATHYFWMIDDIVVSELPANDLRVVDSWVDYLYTFSSFDEGYANVEYFGGYTNIPEQTVGDFVSFRAAVNNFGSADQNFKSRVIITKDGSEVYNETSATVTLSSGLTDTARIETAFTPEGLGFYQVSGSLVMETTDVDRSNNNFKYSFNVTDNFYSRVYESNSSDYGLGGPSDWALGGNDGEAIAQKFDLPAGSGSVKLVGLRFFFPDYDGRTTELAAIENGDFTATAKVWPKGEDPSVPDDNAIAFITSDSRIMTTDDLGTWVYIPFNDESNLIIPEGDENYVWVGLELYNGTTMDARIRWEVGTDQSFKVPFNGGACYILGDANPRWIWGYANYAIDLYLNDMPNLFYNVDMNAVITDGTFNPDVDKVFVTGSFNGWVEPGKGGTIEMYDGDGDGFYSAQITVDKNTEIQYKYFINSGWSKGEWDGDPNRTATVTADSYTTADVWAVKPVGVKENKLDAVKVYPNPFNNQLIIENAANVAKVTISNILGQTMMVKTNLLDKQYISTSGFATGVYLITVTDVNNNNKTIRIVKQ